MKVSKKKDLSGELIEGHRALYNLYITSSTLNKAFVDFLEPFDLTPQQFNLLRILRGADEDSLCLKDVKERLVDRNSDVPRLVKRMELKGLIKRKSDACDKRQSNLRLDVRGSELLAYIDKKDTEFPYSLVSGVSVEDLELWNQLTEKLLASIEEHQKEME
jgi:DNA-binding MarR family transcriptional regulator